MWHLAAHWLAETAAASTVAQSRLSSPLVMGNCLFCHCLSVCPAAKPVCLSVSVCLHIFKRGHIMRNQSFSDKRAWCIMTVYCFKNNVLFLPKKSIYWNNATKTTCSELLLTKKDLDLNVFELHIKFISIWITQHKQTVKLLLMQCILFSHT